MTDKTLIQAMGEALENIKNQSPEEYTKNVKRHSDGAFTMLFNVTCCCGREAKYLHRTEDGDEMSCNKHMICEPYDVIEDELRQVNMKYRSLINLSKDLMTYREETSAYKLAEQQINILIKEYEGK